MLFNNLKRVAAKAEILSRKLVGKRDNKFIQAFSRKTQTSAGVFRRSTILSVVLVVGVICQFLAPSAQAQSKFPIQIDATKLFFRDFFLLFPGGGHSETVSTDNKQGFQLAPGLYGFQFGSGAIADFSFTVTTEGKVTIGNEFSGFSAVTELDGVPTVVINGWEVTIDALHLSGADPARPNETGVLLNNTQLGTESNPHAVANPEDWIALRTIRLLPTPISTPRKQIYSLIVGSALVSSFGFDITRDGKFDYDPEWDSTSTNKGFLTGLGTNKLTLLGYPLTADATAVSDTLNIFVNNFPVARPAKASVVLLPLKGYPMQLSNGTILSFNVEKDGHVSADALRVENEAGQPLLRAQDATANQLTLPFEESGDTPSPLFSITNTGAGQVVFGTNKADNALGFLGGNDRVFHQHAGIYGESDQQGVMGLTSSASGTGVYGGGTNPNAGGQIGVRGETFTGVGVQGQSFGAGVAGKFIGDVNVTREVSANTVRVLTGLEANAVEAVVDDPSAPHPGGSPIPLSRHNGVYASSAHKDASGVYGLGARAGVEGHSFSIKGSGVLGESTGGTGVHGNSDTGTGVWGESSGFDGVHGVSHTTQNAGVAGINDKGGIGVFGQGGTAGLFVGDVTVTGTQTVKVLSITGGADVAESFRMSTPKLPKGSVVVIDDTHDGVLKLSDQAYDPRVAGVVSGAGGIQPGMALKEEGAFESGQNVALSGRVYVLADATNSPIKPGDLLTTSDTPGHAMKVTDYARAQGAVIGKAMSTMKEGKGFVLVLVSLQ
jgi:hypothetical protein